MFGFSLPKLIVLAAIIAVIDGAGRVITTGRKAALPVPFDCEVAAWTLVCDDPWTTGVTMTIDVDRYTYAGYPYAGGSIAGSEKPYLSGTVKNQDLNLTTWATGLDRYDQLVIDVEENIDARRVTLGLYLKRTG